MLARLALSSRASRAAVGAVRSQRWVSSVADLDAIRQSGRRPTREEYETCAMEYAKTQEAMTAFHVLECMSRAGIKPSQDALRAAMGGAIRVSLSQPFSYAPYDAAAEMEQPTFQVGLNQADKPEFVQNGDERAHKAALAEISKLTQAGSTFARLGGVMTLDMQRQFADAFAKYSDRKGYLHHVNVLQTMQKAAEFYQ